MPKNPKESHHFYFILVNLFRLQRGEGDCKNTHCKEQKKRKKRRERERQRRQTEGQHRVSERKRERKKGIQEAFNTTEEGKRCLRALHPFILCNSKSNWCGREESGFKGNTR